MGYSFASLHQSRYTQAHMLRITALLESWKTAIMLHNCYSSWSERFRLTEAIEGALVKAH